MKIKVPFLVLISILISTLSHAGAANVLGGAISYKFISASGGSSVYKVTLELDVTCPSLGMGEVPTNMNVSPEIEVWKAGSRISRVNLSLEQGISGDDIAPLCPADKNQSSCSTMDGAYPGVKRYFYSSDITLEEKNANWSFVFNGVMTNVPYSRAQYNPFVDNADILIVPSGPPPDYAVIYLIATLNNLNDNNSSVVYTSPPTPFCSVNREYTYGLAAADDDNDELKFKLIPSRRMTGSYQNPVIEDVIYYAPFSAEKPLPTAVDGFTLNPTNGQMIFTPNAQFTCLVAVQTDEYRNGEIVGTTVRQMTFFINSEYDNQVAISTVANVQNATYNIDGEGNLYLSACEGVSDTVAFDINVNDPDQNNVTISSDNLPTNASVTIENNETQNPVVHFKWNATEALPVTYSFFLTYTDDGCPYTTQRSAIYSFTLVPHNIKFQNGSSGSCVSTADGKAWVNPIGETSIDYTYKWVDTSTGTILRNVSSKTGDTLTDVPPGIYKVYVRNLDGCGKNIFVKVDTTLLPKLDLPNDTTLCKGMYLAVGTDPEPATTYQWNTGLTDCCFKATETGNYTLNATNHCGTSTASVAVDVVTCNYCFFIPNAFTPNGDGTNDAFKITPTCLTYKYKLFIYNRWGQLVYKTYNLQQSWDGTDKGRDAEIGTYNYVLDATLEDSDQGNVHLTGTVDLIK